MQNKVPLISTGQGDSRVDYFPPIKPTTSARVPVPDPTPKPHMLSSVMYIAAMCILGAIAPFNPVALFLCLIVLVLFLMSLMVHSCAPFHEKPCPMATTAPQQSVAACDVANGSLPTELTHQTQARAYDTSPPKDTPRARSEVCARGVVFDLKV